MAKRRVANPLALAVLSCLWERPMYPYEMTTSMRERGKEDSIRLNFGSLYSVIKSLEKHGLIEAQQTEREGNRPERIVYKITDEGRVEADEWLRELIDTPAREYPAIETGLSLMAMLPPDDVVVLLRRRLERLDAEIAERERSQGDGGFSAVPEIFLVEFYYRLDMLRAERAHLAGLAERLGSGAVGGQDLWARMHALVAEGRTMAEIEAEFAPVFDQIARAGETGPQGEAGREN